MTSLWSFRIFSWAALSWSQFWSDFVQIWTQCSLTVSCVFSIENQQNRSVTSGFIGNRAYCFWRFWLLNVRGSFNIRPEVTDRFCWFFIPNKVYRNFSSCPNLKNSGPWEYLQRTFKMTANDVVKSKYLKSEKGSQAHELETNCVKFH